MKGIDYYLGLPYTKTVRREQHDVVIASVLELPGCIAHGADESEAITRLNRAMRHWLEAALSAKTPIPEPATSDMPSGRWLQRVPRTLHQRLVALAQADGVSLNQLVVSILAEATGGRSVLDWVTSSHLPASPVRRRDVWEHGGFAGAGWHGEPANRPTLHRVSLFAKKIPNRWLVGAGVAHACSYFKDR